MSIYEKDLWPIGRHPGGSDLTLKMINNSKVNKGRVLDVGCGAGESAYMLKTMGFDVVGIDISEDLIKKAKDTFYHENIQFMVEDVKNLSFQNEYFDAIICECVLSGLRDFKLCIHEINRVLKKEGVLLISDICNKSFYDKFLSGFPFKIVEIQLAHKEWQDFVNYLIWNFDDLDEFKTCVPKGMNLKDISYFYGIFKKVKGDE